MVPWPLVGQHQTVCWVSRKFSASLINLSTGLVRGMVRYLVLSLPDLAWHKRMSAMVL